MKFLIFIFLLVSCAHSENKKINLKYPLLIIKKSKGFLACGYINPKACDKTGEACAIVTGVNTHDEMLEKKVISLSKKAKELGIRKGMIGREVLELLSLRKTD